MQRRFLGDRQRIRVFTTQLALDLLRRRISGIVPRTPQCADFSYSQRLMRFQRG